MDNYYIIFINSLYSSLILSPRSETAWFAALGFGGYNMWLATIMAFTGSTLGMGVDWLVGYGLSGARARWFHSSEAAYIRASKYFRRYFVLLLLFPWLPFISFFALLAGLFRVPPLMAAIIIALGRIGYYSYYLLQP